MWSDSLNSQQTKGINSARTIDVTRTINLLNETYFTILLLGSGPTLFFWKLLVKRRAADNKYGALLEARCSVDE